MSTEHIDLSVLEAYVGSTPHELREFVALATQSLQQALAPLFDAMATADLPLLAECSHRAKSTALHIGAEGFATACMALEAAARQGKKEEALALAKQLQHRSAAVQDALQAALKKRLSDGG